MSVDSAIAAIPQGWRLYTVDMSIEGRANVSLRGPVFSNPHCTDMVGAVEPTLFRAIVNATAKAANTYRGWTISQGRWPEPAWSATGPNYDASYEGEEDGWVSNGEAANAPTRVALVAEIDAWFEENAA